MRVGPGEDRPSKTSLDTYGTSNIQLARTALEAKTREFARRSIAKNTERGCRSGWVDILDFCDRHGRQALRADPATVALYYAGLAEAGAKPSTISGATPKHAPSLRCRSISGRPA
ncbi:MAG: hypothetical protein QOK05_590 [Chloroflexota bacterium]|jgi:hypothetical protein|nr:hypothetical protein [Chloroflexota bacterium]